MKEQGAITGYTSMLRNPRARPTFQLLVRARTHTTLRQQLEKKNSEKNRYLDSIGKGYTTLFKKERKRKGPEEKQTPKSSGGGNPSRLASLASRAYTHTHTLAEHFPSRGLQLLPFTPTLKQWALRHTWGVQLCVPPEVCKNQTF